MRSTMASSCPFDAIVVTSPDPDAAPLCSLKAVVPETVSLYSTSDPFGARCGSGGGTLAALEVIDNVHEKTVLIVHAGGESSRCPTQMATGKAWTSLPLRDGTIANPTQLLVSQVSSVFRQLPRSSIVVAASDCLLHLPVEEVDYNSDESVMGLAVPAPLSTACNHGVFCINETRVVQFLQKPSVDLMKKTPHCVIENSDRAWVDTGVVAFLPGAATVLRKLAQTIDHCTCEGLRRLHRKSSSSESLEAFSQHNALQIDLYTHIMLTFSIDSFSAYQANCGDGLPSSIMQKIFTAFSPIKLSALALEKGCFRHLGTSKELIEFLCGQDELSLQIGVVKRANAFANGTQDGCVLTNVVLDTDEAPSIGKGTVLEHIHVSVVEPNIGARCLLSGIRGTCESLRVPDDIVFQMLPFKDSQAIIYMYLGLEDSVKSANTCWGVSFDKLFCDGILDPQDIFGVDTDRTLWNLWNARIHPVVDEPGACQHDKLFSFVAALKRGESLKTQRSSLMYWKSLPRLSLSEIRQSSDAAREFQYRKDLEARVVPEYTSRYLKRLQNVLTTRLNAECKLDSFVASYVANKSWEGVQQVAASFEAVINSSIANKSYDIAGRAFMILSEFLHHLGVATESNSSTPTEVSHDLAEIQDLKARNPSSSDYLASEAFRVLGSLSRNVTGRSYALVALAELFERQASTMTKLCVSSPASFYPTYSRRTAPSPRDTWTIATAPARIDLSGGWSDTPPICVEHGGAVCGIAVNVDGLKPLSCRSRIVTGSSGVVVRAEARDWKSGNLLEERTVAIHNLFDLNGYDDPRASCSLLKCALIYLGLVPAEAVSADETGDISHHLNDFCGCGRDDNVGIEIISTSLLPHGSGMGTSSILGGCILSSIAKCVGFEIHENELVHHVSMLEQMLSTGGGWQDQVSGLYSGAKLGQSVRGLPLKTTVEPIPLSPTVEEEINRRLVLIFTGQTRLAKDILQNVLRRWARRSKEIVQTVDELVTTACRARDSLTTGHVDGLADCLNLYWMQKKVMAGQSSEPSVVRSVRTELLDRDLIVAGSLCGAGGGGFMVLLLQEDRTMNDVELVCRYVGGEAASFTFHECSISTEGLTILVSSASDFQLGWHTTGG